MKVKISKNAAKKIQEELDKELDKSLKLRVYITHKHGDHAHYGMSLDQPTEKDEVVMTDKDIEVIVEKGEPMLDGVRIDYFYVPQEGFAITNPNFGSHDH